MSRSRVENGGNINNDDFHEVNAQGPVILQIIRK
jgi:hypothetical protein